MEFVAWHEVIIKRMKNLIHIPKMEPVTIETFNPNMLKVVNSKQKKAGEINYT